MALSSIATEKAAETEGSRGGQSTGGSSVSLVASSVSVSPDVAVVVVGSVEVGEPSGSVEVAESSGPVEVGEPWVSVALGGSSVSVALDASPEGSGSGSTHPQSASARPRPRAALRGETLASDEGEGEEGRGIMR